MSSPAPRPDTDAVAAPDASAYSQAAFAATPLQVDITAATNADTVECRKTAPTGTRIAIERCEPSADETTRDQMLRDIEAIRRQHWQLEAARQNAIHGVLTPGPAAPAPSPQP